jgi:hypothetical protein
MTTKSHTGPDRIDIPAGDIVGGTLRVRLLRAQRDGWPWGVELEYRYPEEGDDEPGEFTFMSLTALGEIGSFIKDRCADWRREREHAGAP